MGITKHDDSEGARRFKGSGKRGQSLFYTFIIEVVEKELKLISDNYTKYLSYLGKAKDDRLKAMVGFLAIEEALDSLLRAYIPDYGILKIGFPTKVALVRSLKLIPAHLLNAVNIIREIRNEFAHELDKDDFNLLTRKKKDSLTRIFKELHPDDDSNSYTISSMFSTTVSGLLACFGAYASNLELAKEYIYSDDFFLTIKERVRKTLKME